jgi:hypothetical protein
MVVSCQQWTDSTMSLDDVSVAVNTADNTGSVEVWAVAGANEAPTATVEGVTAPLVKSTAAAADPPVPATMTINKPTTFYATIPLPARPPTTPWLLDVSVKSGSITTEKTIRPPVTGFANFANGVLTVRRLFSAV